MTQNECVSTLNSPGAALVAGANSKSGASDWGPCPIFNGSTSTPSIQRNLLATPPRLYDMDDVVSVAGYCKLWGGCSRDYGAKHYLA